MRQDDVRCELGQLCSVFAYLRGTTTSPMGINPHVLANAPTRLLQSLQECPDPGLKILIVRSCVQEHANAPNALGLLSLRRERPCCQRTTENRYELAPSHLPPSQDNASYRVKIILGMGDRCPLWVISGHRGQLKECP